MTVWGTFVVGFVQVAVPGVKKTCASAAVKALGVAHAPDVPLPLQKVDAVAHEVTTLNGNTMAQLAEQSEVRRVIRQESDPQH